MMKAKCQDQFKSTRSTNHNKKTHMSDNSEK